MDDDKVAIAIAEWEGWKNVKPCSCRIKHHGVSPDGITKHIPDYTNDLNAVHSAEKRLIYSKRKEFRINLQRFIIPNSIVATEECIHADARQRCEALLRTIGKWVQ